MSINILIAIAYGLLAIAGGILGYVQAQSKISLIAGVGSGLLLLISAGLQLQGQTWAQFLALAITGVLIVAFIGRYAKTRKFMPAGLMIILGILALLGMLYPMLLVT